MPQKIILYYNSAAGGWTETWYSEATSLPTGFNAAMRNVFTRAIAFRAPPCVLYGVKFIDELIHRKSIPFALADKYKVDLSLTSNHLPDVSSTDAVWRIVSDSGASRAISLRGLRDVDVQRSIAGVDEPSAGLVKSVENYLTATYNAGFRVRVQTNPQNSANVPKLVDRLIPQVGNPLNTQIVLPLYVANTYPNRSWIRFTGIPFNDLIGFPTQAQVIDQVGGLTPGVVIGYRLRGYDAYIPKNMQVQPLGYLYEPMLDWAFQRFSERKTGRNFGSLRGRARPKARAR